MSKRRKSNRWPLVLGILIGASVAVYMYYARSEEVPPPAAGTDAPPNGIHEGLPEPVGATDSPAPATNAQPAVPPDALPEAPPPATLPALSDDEASAAYRRGMELLRSDQFIAARDELNRAYYAGTLAPDVQDALRRTLSELADMTLIGHNTRVYEDDPYTLRYEVQPGDVLARVERQQELHVPWQLILHVNGLARAEDLQAGRVYKLVRGPFHGVVDKKAFTMDIYLQRDGLPRAFIRRLPVGIGRNGSTPAGLWRVRLGGKEVHPTWYPPPNSTLRGAIPYGHPDYAFGPKGLWISLEGLDKQTGGLHDYGIHSTNDPASIGQAGSLGCIRLRDEDIETVFMLLYEHWSTVEVR